MARALVASSLVLARWTSRCNAFVAPGIGETPLCVVWMSMLSGRQVNDGVDRPTWLLPQCYVVYLLCS